MYPSNRALETAQIPRLSFHEALQMMVLQMMALQMMALQMMDPQT